jgi:L-malate glycosyltransferase
MTEIIKFVTFFPECENIHLTKDVGMIPFILHRELQYESYIACYKNGDYPRLEKEVKGLKILFLKKNSLFFSIQNIVNAIGINNKIIQELQIIFDSLVFFTKYRNKFTILQVFHIQFRSIFISFIFRLTNRKGLIYLKLDMNPCIIEDYRKSPYNHYISNALKLLLLKCIPVHIISAETKILSNFLCNEHRFFKRLKNNIFYIPNGVDIKNESFSKYIQGKGEKENIILHVGRIGAYEKGSDIIIEAFSRISDQFPEWNLIFIGSIEPSFEAVLRRYNASNVANPGRIMYTGLLPTYSDVFEYYQKAKIVAMPSKSESFGLTLLEAGLCGDTILGSKIPAIQEITNDDHYGFLCNVEDTACFADSLRYIITHQKEAEEKSSGFRDYIVVHYDWNKICAELNNIIVRKRSG